MKKRSKITTVLLVLFCIALGVGGTVAAEYYISKDEKTPSEILDSAKTVDVNVSPEDVFTPPEVQVTSETVRELIEDARKLITTEYYYTNVFDIKKYRHFFKTDAKIPFTTDESVCQYDGTISVGVDLSKIEYGTIDNDNKTIEINLPYPTIISHELDMDSFEWYDVRNSVFTNIKPKDTTKELNNLKKNQEKKLEDKLNFYESAKDNTKKVIEDLFGSNSLTADYDVIITFDDPVEFSDDEQGELAVPKDAKEYIGEKYNDVEQSLRDAGFTDIEVKSLGDLKMGIFAKDGTVDSITITGDSDFKKGDYFYKNAKIRIKYHSY